MNIIPYMGYICTNRTILSNFLATQPCSAIVSNAGVGLVLWVQAGQLFFTRLLSCVLDIKCLICWRQASEFCGSTNSASHLGLSNFLPNLCCCGASGMPITSQHHIYAVFIGSRIPHDFYHYSGYILQLSRFSLQPI